MTVMGLRAARARARARLLPRDDLQYSLAIQEWMHVGGKETFGGDWTTWDVPLRWKILPSIAEHLATQSQIFG